MIGVVNITFDVQNDMNTLSYLYNTAKSALGVSRYISRQGRHHR